MKPGTVVVIKQNVRPKYIAGMVVEVTDRPPTRRGLIPGVVIQTESGPSNARFTPGTHIEFPESVIDRVTA